MATLVSAFDRLNIRQDEIFPARLADITLIVGNGDDKRTFHTLRGMLRAHSPVFDAMLNGRWVECNNDRPVLCPDDDPDAFELFLRILHHKARRQDAMPKPQLLVNFAKLCDKYDVVPLVRDLIEWWTWIAQRLDTPKLPELPEELYLVGWTLGWRSCFGKDGMLWRRGRTIMSQPMCLVLDRERTSGGIGVGRSNSSCYMTMRWVSALR